MDKSFDSKPEYIAPDSYYHKLYQAFLDCRAGVLLDPVNSYRLNHMLQYCNRHDAEYHMDCIHLDTINSEGWHIAGDTCNIHRDRLDEIPLSEREPLAISSKYQVSSSFPDYDKMAFGLDFPQGEAHWFFCSRCIHLHSLIYDILVDSWPNILVRKYSNIWIDWSRPKIEWGNFNRRG
jgi:hypothetical protein